MSLNQFERLRRYTEQKRGKNYQGPGFAYTRLTPKQRRRILQKIRKKYSMNIRKPSNIPPPF